MKYAVTAAASMYVLALITLFFGIYEQEAQLFYNEVSEITNFSEFNDDEYYRGKNTSSESFIPEYFCDSYQYYSAIALYDKNGELVHTNGTIVSFLENHKWRYCYLDEFMSEEDYQSIVSFGNNGNVSCESFKYYENDNKEIVPVEILLRATRSKKTLLSNKKTIEETKLKLEFPDNAQVKYVVSDSPIYLRMQELDSFENKVDRVLYRRLIEQVKSETDREYGYKNFKNNDVEELASGGGSTGGYEACFDYSFKLQEEPYFAVIRVEYNPVIKILTDGLFHIMAVFFTITSLIAFLIMRYYFSLYYDKKQRLEEVKYTLTSATAHELKTPISIIQNQCECIIENIAPEKNGEYVESIYVETQRMNKIVCDFLQYNRLVQSDELQLVEADLTKLVNDEVLKYQSLFDSNGKTVKLDLCENTIVKINPEMISLVINNFFSNAVKHSEYGGNIEIKLEYNPGSQKYKFSVFNSGSHIDDDLKKNIWTVLHKTDKSRTGDGGSGGMGLAISSRILELHNCSYGCKNVKDGVEFWFFI